MRDYKWRTAPTGTEGTNTVYVDSYTGSDIYGVGTRANPYKSLTRAWTVSTTKPSNIICRGTFTDVIEGSHTTNINADYPGAAMYDGLSTGTLYGFGHNNMKFVNTPALSVSSPLVGGLGRAFRANNVGNAGNVSGLAGSNNYAYNCGLYMGTIGTMSPDVKYCVWANPRCNSTYRISIAGSSTTNFTNNTVYGCRIENRQKHYNRNMYYSLSVFSNFDMIANDNADTYNFCLFTSDCKWYYLTGENTDSTYYELTITGNTSAERQQSLLDALTAKYDELNIASGNRKFPTFNDCIFSSSIAAQIFNNPEKDDFTLIPGCDADTGERVLQGTGLYIGALPPAINIPIMTNSTGVPRTWDEHSVSGCLSVDNNEICVDPQSASLDGEILSKVISINPITTQINGVFANFTSKYTNYYTYANSNSFIGNTYYEPGDIMPIGNYIVNKLCTYQEETIGAYNKLVITEDNTTFSSEESGAKAFELVEPNVMEVVYCRCRNAIYATVGQSDTLQAGATYLNNSGNDITYHNRTVANGESFVCMITGEQFTAIDPDARIAVMFDDTRVPAVEWVPAQLFGEYFVAKLAGAIQKDAYNVPLSSGNYLSYQTSGLLKSTMDRKYIQFAIKVKRDDFS